MVKVRESLRNNELPPNSLSTVLFTCCDHYLGMASEIDQASYEGSRVTEYDSELVDIFYMKAGRIVCKGGRLTVSGKVHTSLSPTVAWRHKFPPPLRLCPPSSKVGKFHPSFILLANT